MKYKLIYFLLFLTVPLFSQRLDDGERLFNEGRYEEAKSIYSTLLKKKPKDKLTNYRYARVCYELNQIDEAIKHFEIAGENYFSGGYYLGKLYTSRYEFERAIKAYNSYLKLLKSGDENIPLTEEKISQCEMAERFLARVEDIVIVDSLIVNKDRFLDFYTFHSELGTLKQENVVFDSLHREDKITYTTERNDRIYFSDSIRGQMDLFTSYRLLDKWSKPQSLSENINTDANENYPFLLLDGVTLYFGSDGQNSIGGYDIFITKYIPANNAHLTPENIGMPFNSPYNDYMMVIDEGNKLGWFATDRYQTADSVVIYTFIPNEVKKIIRSEDENFIRRSAQLKTYRLGELPDERKNNHNIGEPKEKEFEFVIYDKWVYTRKDQFQSNKALRQWEILNEEIIQNEKRKEQLNSLREKYSGASESELTVLTPQIIELEKMIRNEEEKISALRMEVCNEEIKYLHEMQK